MSKIFFQCPACGKISEAKPLYYHSGLKLGAICYCEDGTANIDIQVKENDFPKLLDRMNIKWAYDDKVRWKTLPERRFNETGIALLGEDFIYYDTALFNSQKGDFYMFAYRINDGLASFCDSTVYKSKEEAQQACEEDFQKRKASNE